LKKESQNDVEGRISFTSLLLLLKLTKISPNYQKKMRKEKCKFEDNLTLTKKNSFYLLKLLNIEKLKVFTANSHVYCF